MPATIDSEQCNHQSPMTIANPQSTLRRSAIANRQSDMRRVTIGVGGPVGSGKTALLDSLCKRMREHYSIAVVTNDIYTYEDAEFLMRSGALPRERIRGVQTGGCPHTAIREDTSINHEAIDQTIARF